MIGSNENYAISSEFIKGLVDKILQFSSLPSLPLRNMYHGVLKSEK
jgi:hypothetical protein